MLLYTSSPWLGQGQGWVNLPPGPLECVCGGVGLPKSSGSGGSLWFARTLNLVTCEDLPRCSHTSLASHVGAPKYNQQVILENIPVGFLSYGLSFCDTTMTIE